MEIPGKGSAGSPVLVDAVLGKPFYIIHLAEVYPAPISITKDKGIKIVFRAVLQVIEMELKSLRIPKPYYRKHHLVRLLKKLNGLDGTAVNHFGTWIFL